jgi:hypothetical protein
MTGTASLSDRKKLERIYLQGRERGKAAERWRLREERDLFEDDHEQQRHDDDDE